MMNRDQSDTSRKLGFLVAAFIVLLLITKPPRLPAWATRWWGERGAPGARVDSAQTVAPAVPLTVYTAKDSIWGIIDGGLGDEATWYEFGYEPDLDPNVVGAIPRGAMLDSTTTVDLFGDAQARVGLVPVDTAALKSTEIGCVGPVSVKLRRAVGQPSTGWLVGLRSGTAQAVPFATPRDSLAGKAEALRLAELVPQEDRVIVEGLPTADKLFAGMPVEIERIAYFMDGGREFMVVQARRVKRVTHPENDSLTVSLSESVFLVGSRPAGDVNAPFALEQGHRRVSETNEAVRDILLKAFHVGNPSRLIIISSVYGENFNGGSIEERKADGQWKRLGGWASVCD